MIAAGGAALALACSAPAAAPAAAPPRGADVAVRTPAARPGTAAAAKTALTASQLRRHLASQLRAAGTTSGAFVADLDARHHLTLFHSGANRRLILASNTKLFTTAAYLERFGRNRRLATKLWVRGRRSGPNRGRLHGSLALVGAGDPALAAGSFARRHNLPATRVRPLAVAVRATGIRRVDGNIRVDPTIFDSKRVPRQTGISGVFLGAISGLEYDSGYDRGAPAANPAKLAGAGLRRALRAEGVKVTGKIVAGGVPHRVRGRAPLAAVLSPRTAGLIREVNTPSDATWAEMLTKRLVAGGGRPATTAHGARAIERFARRAGSAVSLENGSGLSRLDVSSARDVVHLLRATNGGRDGRAYRRSLPLACATGTVANRMCGTSAAGNCRTKTGTLIDVSALSGYCTAGSHRIAFSVLMNDVTDFGAATLRQDRIAALIARYRP